MALLRCCLLWLLLPIGCGTQKLPTRDEELFQMQIRDKAFFHDSSVIPDGAEISSYLFRDTLKRYFFVVEEDNTPLSVTVTPCDVPLEWKLSLQELPEETSGEGSGATEMRQTNFRCLIRNPVFPQWHRQSVEWGVFWRRFRPRGAGRSALHGERAFRRAVCEELLGTARLCPRRGRGSILHPRHRWGHQTRRGQRQPRGPLGGVSPGTVGLCL
ncbi:protein NDNF-like [Lemur catta]|uniref:protein NDNF-like n=1 Tax=Lemur catta TaxID=9447 RepID=UPI001E267961|nr:protein NDNF-like [Lemur catta]